MTESNEETTCTYEEFMALVPGELLSITSVSEDENDSEDDYEVDQRVLHICDIEGVRFILVADSEELASQDGADEIFCTGIVLGFDTEDQAVSEVMDREIWKTVVDEYRARQDHKISIEAPADALFIGTSSDGVTLADYQSRQLEWDSRYGAEEGPLQTLRSLSEAQMRLAALSSFLIDCHEMGDQYPDPKGLQDECAILLSVVMSDILRVSTRLDINLQEAFHQTMAGIEQEAILELAGVNQHN